MQKALKKAARGMNSKEELEKCFESVYKDLEVLEILKRHLKIKRDDNGFEEIVAYTRNYGTYSDKDQFPFCNFFGGLDNDAPHDAMDDFRKVKEWLEK
jgi:hypothetical protein